MGTALTNYIKNMSDFKLLYSIDKDNSNLIYNISKKPDVIIDFSTVNSSLNILDYAVENLIPIVIATTGFSQDDENKISEFSEAIPIFKSSNMSYGINIFSNIVSSFSQYLKDMDIEIIEKHHRKKVDAPSGTALMIANDINKKNNNTYKYVFNRNNTKNMSKSYNEIGFSSVRGGSLIGEHTVMFLGTNECICLTHTAYSRNIYIEGTLKAAKFIISKKTGLYGMTDLIETIK